MTKENAVSIRSDSIIVNKLFTPTNLKLLEWLLTLLYRISFHVFIHNCQSSCCARFSWRSTSIEKMSRYYFFVCTINIQKIRLYWMIWCTFPTLQSALLLDQAQQTPFNNWNFNRNMINVAKHVAKQWNKSTFFFC